MTSLCHRRGAASQAAPGVSPASALNVPRRAGRDEARSRPERPPHAAASTELALEQGPTNAQVGLWAFLATVIMLFAGFTSAILVRRTASDWPRLPVPGSLWVNTAILVVSSITLERARRLTQRQRSAAAKNWLRATMLLGLLFLAGQAMAWRVLSASGLYLSSNPHSSFFYILTGAHGVHLLCGLLALLWLLVGSRATRTRLKVCATYWHFLDALWIYVFVVLFVL